MAETVHVKASMLIKDIRARMSRSDMMKKYGISAQGLQSAFKQLLDAGVIKPSDLTPGTPISDMTPGMPESDLNPETPILDEPSGDQDQRVSVRYDLNFTLYVHEPTAPSVKGTVLDVSERGLRVKGIKAAMNDVKTLVIPSYFGSSTFRSIIIVATCRWAKGQENNSESWVCGFEIMERSEKNFRELQKLIMQASFSEQ
jgi:hypothetical protein